jgi:membrane-associated PAP2 superfamily phosphatase
MGLSLIALTIAIHAISVTFMVFVLHSFRGSAGKSEPRLAACIAIVIGTITTTGLLLAALHMIEAAFWAAAYLWLGALGSLEAAEKVRRERNKGIRPKVRDTALFPFCLRIKQDYRSKGMLARQ